MMPGVRIVERDHLDAALGELSLSQLLGPDSVDKRLTLGRLVKADALVILADDDRAGFAAAAPAGRAMARVVICDCATGARLFDGQAAIDPIRQAQGEPGKPDGTAPQELPLPLAVADAVARTRQRYPSGVGRIVGTSPFVNHGLTNDYDLFQDRFAALLNNAVSLVSGVAVLEIDEARSIAKEQQIAGVDALGAARLVPLIIEGDFQVTQTRAAATQPNPPAAATTDLSVAFTVSLSDGKGTLQKLRKTVSLAEAPGFLTREVPDVAAGDLQLQDRQPVSAGAQFDALVRRAGEFARLGAFEQSVPLREAALLLQPTDAGQHERLVDEYQRLSMPLVSVPGQTLPQLTAAERDRKNALHDAQWQAGIEHLEYLVRNRLIDRPHAIRAAAHYRARYPAAIPDGPPRLREFFSEVYPAVLALEPGKTALPLSSTVPALPTTFPSATTQTSLPPDEINQLEKIAWLAAFFGPAASNNPDRMDVPLTSAAPAVLTDDAADFLADMIVRWFPDDVFLPRSAGYVFERVPVSETYLRFLDCVEKSGKAPYGFWVRLARLRMQCLAEIRLRTTQQAATDLIAKIDALERDYRGVKLHGQPPGPTDPLLVAIARLRARATGAPPPTVAAYVPVGVPSTNPSPITMSGPVQGSAIDKGNRLWFVPIPVRRRTVDSDDSKVDSDDRTPRNTTVDSDDRAISSLIAAGGSQRTRARDRDGPAPPSESTAWPAQEQLLSAGPALDVVWSSRHILFWQQPDLLQEVFNATTAANADSQPDATGGKRTIIDPPRVHITDVKWDGKRVWVAYTLIAERQVGGPDLSSALAIIDADGKTIQRIGTNDGLPPADQALLIHPISEGRVVAIGSFGDHQRGWCALVTAGVPGGRTQVNVFHQAVAINPLSPGAGKVDDDSDSAFRPTWLAECRPGSPAGPWLLLVGRAAATQSRPLVIDLASLKVSVSATAFTHDDSQQATQAFAALNNNDSFLEMHNSSLYRYQLTWDGSRLSGTPALAASGDASAGPFERLLPAGDYVYLFGNRRAPDNSWLRCNLKSKEVERIETDYLVARDGPCTAFGFSSRFGLIGWGQQVCRLVVSRDRPAGALQRKLFLTPMGIKARFEPQDPSAGTARPASPTDAPEQVRSENSSSAAGALTGGKPPGAARPPVGAPKVPKLRTDPAPSPLTLPAEPLKPATPPPTLDDLIGHMNTHDPAKARSLSRLAELNPDTFAPEKKRQTSDALIPLITAGDAGTSQLALRAFAVWHARESEPLLLAALQAPEAAARRHALEAIGLCKDPAIIPDVLRQLAKDPSPTLGCLVAIGPASEPALLALLARSNSPNSNGAVIDALAMIGTSRSVPALRAILDQHPDRQTTEVTRQALEMIQQRQR